jgi:hypothetical protein
MEYIDAILGHVVPIISEASKSKFGLVSLTALIALAIVLLFLYLSFPKIMSARIYDASRTRLVW